MPAPDSSSVSTLLDTLRLVAGDATLERQLESICHLIEHERAGCRASILILEGNRLRHGAALSLDPAYCRLIDGIEIGPAVGCCGTAAFHRRTVIAADTATDPRWAGMEAVLARHHLAACWSQPILDARGDVLGTFGIYRDTPGEPEPEDLESLRRAADIARVVLERERRRRELDETRDWLDLALGAAGAGLWDLDVPTRRLTVSASVLGMLGIDHDGGPVDLEQMLELVHPDDHEATLRAAIHQVTELPGRLELSFRMRAADGGFRWIRSTGRVVGRDVDGMPTRVIGQQVDDTQRRMIEQRERELSDRLLKISTIAPAMFHQLRIDAQGEATIPYVSDAVRTLFDLAPADVIADADALYRRVHPHDLEGVWAAIRRSHARMEPWRHEFRVQHPDGSLRWLLGHATPERGPEGSVVWHGYMSDITGQKMLEERLIQTSELAMEASRAKSAFITNLSHELRTPLTSILGFMDLMEQGVIGADEASRRDAVRTIRRNGSALLEIIDDMLDLARIESRRLAIELIATDPRHVVEEVVEAARERAEARGLVLDVVHDTPVPELVETDPARLRQVLGQLLDNAIKFTDAGEVTVRLAVRDGDGAGEPSRLLIAVQDTGIGMSERELEQAFDAFTQADASLTRAHGGAGLGLRIARSLTQMLGGELRATSRPGAGSAFTVSLAIAAGESAAGRRQRERQAGEPAPRGTARDADTRSAMELIAAMDPASPSDFGIVGDDAAAGVDPRDSIDVLDPRDGIERDEPGGRRRAAA